MKEDSYSIQEATESDLTGIANFFKQENFVLREEHLLRWKYFSNPAGPPRILMVTNGSTDPIGILTFMPREFKTPSGHTIMLMQAVDAFFSRELRGKGMLRKLIEYSKQVIHAPVYSFPNKLAENTMRKSGWKFYSEVDSWFFPIDIGQRLSGRIGRYCAPLGNLIGKMYAYIRLGGLRDDIEVARVKRFQREIPAPTNQAWGLRSADYLNWRFIDNALKEYRCYEFFEAGECIGYCVIGRKDANSELYDFIVWKNQKKCLRKVIEICRQDSVQYLFCRAVGVELSKMGFIKLKSLSNLIVYDLPNYPWSLMACDCDWD